MGHHLAQVNIARPLEPLDSPLLAEFVAQLDTINALADRSPGFVWRLQDDSGNATSVRAFDDESLLINMSVWESVDDLAGFVYRSGHVAVMRRRREWFERMRMYMALWWVPAGHVPAPAEARARLEHLQEHGPTPFAFTFKVRFEPLSASPERASDPGRPRSGAATRNMTPTDTNAAGWERGGGKLGGAARPAHEHSRTTAPTPATRWQLD